MNRRRTYCCLANPFYFHWLHKAIGKLLLVEGFDRPVSAFVITLTKKSSVRVEESDDCPEGSLSDWGSPGVTEPLENLHSS